MRSRLRAVARRVLDAMPAPAARTLRERRRWVWAVTGMLVGPSAAPDRPPVAAAPVRLVVGPANFAGQAWEWGRAAERELPGVSSTVVSVLGGVLDFESDYAVPQRVYRSPRWSRGQERWIRESFTHALVDAVRPMTGPWHGLDARADVARFRAAGLHVGLIAHGSDIRLPSRHREIYPYSPFEPGSPETVRREVQARRLGDIFNGDQGPLFVSTPDLLDFAPRARWLPTVVDTERGRTDAAVLERARPVVLHLPTNAFLKGTAALDPVLARLDAAGIIDYRRPSGVAPERMPALVADADVVVDQLTLGFYGVMAVQAMAAGRLVVAHVAAHVRDRLPRPLPVVESTPYDIAEVLGQVLADRPRFRDVAKEGVDYVREVHDGRRAAEVLAPFLGAEPARRNGD